MAAKYWLKLYHEMLDDPKVARLPDSSYRRFIECLLLAGESNDNGTLPPIEDMAWRLRVDETSLKDDMTRLALSGLVELNENGRWFVTSFDKRQKGLSKAEYMKRLRDERQTSYQDVTNPVTNSNADKDKDKDEIREDRDEIETQAPAQSSPRFEVDIVAEYITALSSISSTPYWEKTKKEYEDAAFYIIGLDGTKEQVKSFHDWWLKNTFYNNRQEKARLTTVLDKWNAYTNDHVKVNSPVEKQPERVLDPETNTYKRVTQDG